jgi:hypothetical protein
MTEELCSDFHHARDFLTFKVPRLTLALTEPDIQWVQDILSAGKKTPGNAAEHLSPSSARVKKVCNSNHITIFLYGMMHS